MKKLTALVAVTLCVGVAMLPLLPPAWWIGYKVAELWEVYGPLWTG